MTSLSRYVSRLQRAFTHLVHRPTPARALSALSALSAMTASSFDRLEEMICALSRSRDVLALLISKIDAELIPLKIQRNAQSPSHRLPDELLVRIFELVQLRDDAHDGWLSAETSLPEKDWWRVMSVCARFRNIAVEAPELWTRFDRGWSARWRDVCLPRAKSWPLRSSVRVTDWTSAWEARELLEHSGHAKLILTELPDASAWNADNLYALEASMPSLLSLMIGSDGSRDTPTLMLAPPLLVNYTSLSHLQLCIKLEINDAFAFPPTLQWLYLREFSISSTPDRLRRLFQGIPHLRHFEAVMGVGTIGQNQLGAEPETSTIVMPSLECLILTYCDMAVTHAILRIISSAQRVLKLCLNYDLAEDVPSENYRAQMAMLADVLACAQRFWAQYADSTQLLPVILQDWQVETSNPYTSCCVLIQGGEKEDPSSPALSINLYNCPFTPDNPLLPHVAKLELIRMHAHSGPPLDVEKWPVLSRLSALRTLNICGGFNWEFIDVIQAWADRQAQQPILVELSPGRQRYDPFDYEQPTLQWSSADGPLKDAGWSAYIAAVHARQPLPESHDGDSWDGDDRRDVRR